MHYFIIICLFLSACQFSSVPEMASPVPVTSEDSTAALPVLQLGTQQLKIELACTDQAQQQGLMFREHLPADQGMLFVFEQAQILKFWMRNTTLPLSIAYIDTTGVIIEIHDLEPLNETPVPSSQPVSFALEVNQGWFQAHKIEPGLRIQLDSFCSDPTP